jgi:hypothetical protein
MMSTAEMATAAIKGTFDKFDACIGIANWIEAQIDDDHDELQYHPESLFTDAHLFSKNESIREDLCRARELISEACQLCQNALAAV